MEDFISAKGLVILVLLVLAFISPLFSRSGHYPRDYHSGQPPIIIIPSEPRNDYWPIMILLIMGIIGVVIFSKINNPKSNKDAMYNVNRPVPEESPPPPQLEDDEMPATFEDVFPHKKETPKTDSIHEEKPTANPSKQRPAEFVVWLRKYHEENLVVSLKEIFRQQPIEVILMPDGSLADVIFVNSKETGDDLVKWWIKKKKDWCKYKGVSPKLIDLSKDCYRIIYEKGNSMWSCEQEK